ncbi:PucR family transcriptional regulator [Kineococcus rhizosphaerae]|uniref:PucR family transcriptional regulator n=1 Tax=Kineococcus rhizosphaerae TaxID=559628 RepID=UPI001474EBB7|nr:PucR family transcriptional regulator [Kineococcus rhizosphaerae]
MVQLADLLATPSLDLRLVVGDPGVAVRWVATSELDDPTAFLEGGELLLTTGLRVPRAGWARWVERLVAAGVSGVGFGVGLSHRTVPRTLVTAAGTAGLALVEVPVPTPFIAVSRRLADLLRRGENEAEAAAARAQRDLTVAATGPDGTRAVLVRAARAVGGSAWLLDAAGTVLAASTAAAPSAAALDGLRRVRGQGARAAWSEVTATGSSTLLASGTSRWLLVTGAPGAPRAVRGTLGTAAALLGLLTSRPGGEATSVLTAVVVDLVLDGRVDPARRLAGTVGLDLPDPVVVVRWAGTAPAGALVAERYALFGAGEVPALAGRAGVGRAVALTGAGEGRRTADLAFARTTAERPVVLAGDRSLPDLLDGEVLTRWSRERLAGLDPELREAVQVFLAHHGARQPTAEALGLHRNTLRHRLSRAQEILGVSWEDPTDRAEVWLALTARPS